MLLLCKVAIFTNCKFPLMQKTDYFWPTVSIKEQLTLLYKELYPSEILLFRNYQVKNLLGFLLCTFDC